MDEIIKMLLLKKSTTSDIQSCKAEQSDASSVSSVLCLSASADLTGRLVLSYFSMRPSLCELFTYFNIATIRTLSAQHRMSKVALLIIKQLLY